MNRFADWSQVPLGRFAPGGVSPFGGVHRREVAAWLLGAALVVLPLVYLFFLPVFPWLSSYNSYNGQRLWVLLLLTLVCGLGLISGVWREQWLQIYFFLHRRSRWLLWALFMLGLAGSLVAAYPWFALLEVAHFALLFVGVITIAALRARLGQVFDWLLAIALVAIGWEYLVSFLDYYLVAVNHRFDLTVVRLQLLEKFSHPRFFGQWQSWTLPLMVLPMLLVSRPLPWFLSALLLLPATGWWLLLFASGTRGTLLGCLVALVVTTVLYRRRALPWLRWHLPAAAGGFLAFRFFYYWLPSRQTAAEGAGESVVQIAAGAAQAQDVIGRAGSGLMGRDQFWRSAWEMMLENPLLGVGPMHYADYGHRIVAHPHNATLQIAAEWGLPALLVVLSLFVYGILCWWRDDPGRCDLPEPGTAALRPALCASLVGAAVHAQFSGIIVMPISQLMLVLVLGWMLGIACAESAVHRAELTAAPPPPPRRAHLLLILFFMLVLAGIAKPLSDQLPVLERVHREFSEENMFKRSGHFRPRFWQQGYLAPYYPEDTMLPDVEKIN